uniref:KH-like RNA-binding domain-containing protein n=4 Tax=Macaca TaxID=9539 RepID=A0A7N9DAR5_MACFA
MPPGGHSPSSSAGSALGVVQVWVLATGSSLRPPLLSGLKSCWALDAPAVGSASCLLHRAGGRRALGCFPCRSRALPAGSPPLPLERASRGARGPGGTAVSSQSTGPAAAAAATAALLREWPRPAARHPHLLHSYQAQPWLPDPRVVSNSDYLLCGIISSLVESVSCVSAREHPIWSEQSMDMGTSALSKKPWWTLPENFHAPMVFHMEEDQEELIFGHGDTYLRCIEVHSHTLIQLESWFTATGQTRVTVVGPHRARQWLLHMFCCVGSQDSYHHARGLEMLEQVRSQPLTNDDLVTSISVPPYTGDLSLAPRISGTICLSVPQPSPYQVIGCSGFHLSSLYP